jgi:hypothetical protein
MPQLCDVESGDVVEDKKAEAGKVEEISEQDCGGNNSNMRGETKAVNVTRDKCDEAHRDGAADSIAAWSDEHAEVRREHEAKLVVAERLAERDGEGTRYMCGDSLKGEIDVDVEDVRDGVDEPDEDYGKESGAIESGSSEEQDYTGDVGKSYERVRWEVDGPLRRDDEDENCLIADVDGCDGNRKDDKPPETALHLPLLGTPYTKNEHGADQRDHHANGFECIHGPQLPEQADCRPDGAQTQDRECSCETRILAWREACHLQHETRANISRRKSRHTDPIRLRG